MLDAVLAEIEAHVARTGWDQRPALFALVRAGQFTADDPQTAARLGVDTQPPDALTPVEQGELPEQPLDEVLAGIEWPTSIAGCVVSQEIVILPPSAEAALTDDTAAASVAEHPDRREARIVVGVLRDGTSAAVLRMRPAPGSDAADDLLTGPDLAPNLVEALLATFA